MARYKSVSDPRSGHFTRTDSVTSLRTDTSNRRHDVAKKLQRRDARTHQSWWRGLVHRVRELGGLYTFQMRRRLGHVSIGTIEVSMQQEHRHERVSRDGTGRQCPICSPAVAELRRVEGVRCRSDAESGLVQNMNSCPTRDNLLGECCEPYAHAANAMTCRSEFCLASTWSRISTRPRHNPRRKSE